MTKYNTTLFVSGVGPRTRARDLAYEFERYGPLIRCDIPAPRKASNRPSYAFVEFIYYRDADDAYYEMHDRKFDGYILDIQWAKNRPSPTWRYDEDGRGGHSRSGRSHRSRSRSRRRRSRSSRSSCSCCFSSPGASDKKRLSSRKDAESSKPGPASSSSRSHKATQTSPGSNTTEVATNEREPDQGAKKRKREVKSTDVDDDDCIILHVTKKTKSDGKSVGQDKTVKTPERKKRLGTDDYGKENHDPAQEKEDADDTRTKFHELRRGLADEKAAFEAAKRAFDEEKRKFMKEKEDFAEEKRKWDMEREKVISYACTVAAVGLNLSA
ncbi:hypothetical protein HDV00_012173 [Rhizophlyctis rosea]|nr:hypothetical protein HDV00_012173 [Rhizophlyctis rosea]